MLADDETAGQAFFPARRSAESEFSQPTALRGNGYDNDVYLCTDRGLLGTLSNILGLESADFARFGKTISIDHQLVMDEHHFGNQYFPPTNAQFSQVVNAAGGMLVACENPSPPEANRQADRPLHLDVPHLQKWSDVAFLQWKRYAPVVSDLQYVLRHKVMNETTESVMQSINAANGSTTLAWPGASYDATSFEGQALLGTPNGSGVAYMLIQHKCELGHKVVDKIIVFEEDRELMLLFQIFDVGAPSEAAVLADLQGDVIMSGM
jgi:hypothetical protein